MDPDTDRTAHIPALQQLRDELLRVAHEDQASAPKRHTLTYAIAALVAVTLLGTSTLVGIIANREPDQQDRAGPVLPGGFEAEEETFSSLDELAANSDLVVLGSVKQTLPGEVIGDEGVDDEFPTSRVSTVLAVERVLKGRELAPTIMIDTLELAYGGAINDPRNANDWRRKSGARVVAFLKSSTEGKLAFYPTVYAQSFYVIADDVLTPVVQNPADVLNEINGMTVSEFSQTMQDVDDNGN